MRMRRHAEDPGVFIRSVSSHGHLGGPSESMHRIVDAMDAAGRDFIIIETVGAGQSEVEVVEIADVCVVVNAPNMGDEVQAMKAGILEIADVLVVNKSDLPLAQRTTKQLTNMLELRRDNRDVPVVETVALTETGIDALQDAIARRLAAGPGDKQKRRERRMRGLIAERAGRIVRDLVRDADGGDLAHLVEAAASGEIGIDAAARRALKAVL
jgi:LAO/AO transport system kinase